MKPNTPPKDKDETLDSFYHGRILVLQKEKGYRFSVDAPLLADFIQTKASDEILELGAGNGIISLLLSIKPFRHITAVEIQESLADLAKRNIKLNNLENQITVVQEDLRHYDPGRKYDVIFSNPPYIKKGQGHLSLIEEKSIAKHEIKCDIYDVIHKTVQLLKSKGRAYFIFLTRRKKDLLQVIEREGLKLKSMRYVHPRQDSPPHFLMVECDFSSERGTTWPPFILYDEEGSYTLEALEIFQGRAPSGRLSSNHLGQRRGRG